MTLGDRLRRIRDARGLNQEAFAGLAGVSRNTQANYESGKRPPDSDYLMALAEHGLDVAYLLTGTQSTDRLSPTEGQLLDLFRRIDDEWQRTILSVASKAAGVKPSTIPDPDRSYSAG